MLTLEDVTKRYGELVALDALTLEAQEGELLSVLGPSGSGKTTALRVIAGLERPDSGLVRIAGADMGGVPPARRGVAMVFQGFALFPHLTAAQNVVFGLAARGVEERERQARLRDIAERLHLEPVLARRPAELSGGERQRVALARALVGRPRLLLLDEPLSNLDAPLRARARAELRAAVEASGVTALHVTHDQAEALSLGSRVAVMRAGRLEQVGAPREVYARPASAFVARFVGSPGMNLVDAVVEDGELRAGALRLPLTDERLSDGQSVLAGFRAEHVAVGSEGFPGDLIAVEEAGHERLWQVRVGSLDLAVRPSVDARVGETVHLSVPAEAVRLFDPESERAL